MRLFLMQNSWLIVIAVIWTLYWKGRALWRAARNGDKGWFVALLVINTLGILEMIYIF
jgi:methionyl-tRNA synthetase